MKSRSVFLLAGLVVALGAGAEIPPPEKLLPRETVMLISVPDVPAAWSACSNSSYGRLWRDPAVKPLADKFSARFKADVIDPVEREFGFRFSDYIGQARGQITFALVNAENDQSETNASFASVLLMDSKDRSPNLTTNLANLKRQWIDSGKQTRTEKVRDIEFTTLIFARRDLSDAWARAFPKPAGDKKQAPADDPASGNDADKKLEITFCQIDSLLIAGNSASVMERILSRYSGGLVPGLNENPLFEADYGACFRNAPAYAWICVEPLIGGTPRDKMPGAVNGGRFGLTAMKLFRDLGLNSVKTISVSAHDSPEGMTARLFIRAPESERAGLWKVLALENKNSDPPAFVPSDAARFKRLRLNLTQSWNALEQLLARTDPTSLRAINGVLQEAGKSKDEKYNLKAELLAGLGDDVITYEKPPTNNTSEDRENPPSMLFIGSPNAEKLAAAVKVALTALGKQGEGGGAAGEREFLGRKVYSAPSTETTLAGEPRIVHFSASCGYVGISSSVTMLEEWLRNAEKTPKSLAETPGLAEAAQKVGGMNTGFLGFDNHKEIMRAAFVPLREHSGPLNDFLSDILPSGKESSAPSSDKSAQWFDSALLPSFDAIAPFFHFWVYAASISADGLTIKLHMPTPPLSMAPDANKAAK